MQLHPTKWKKVTINPLRDDGVTPARIDGAVTWALRDADGDVPLQTQPAFVNDDGVTPDPLSVWVGGSPGDQFGDNALIATADIDLGDGDDAIDNRTATLGIHVPDEEVSSFSFTEGGEVDAPPAPPAP